MTFVRDAPDFFAFLHLRIIAVVEGLIALRQGELASLESRELLSDCRITDRDWRDVTHLMSQVHDFNIFFDAPHIVNGDLPSLAVAACARPACLSVESVVMMRNILNICHLVMVLAKYLDTS